MAKIMSDMIFDIAGETLSNRSAKVLDLGCGSGDEVQRLLGFGVDAYGADVAFKNGAALTELEKTGRLKRIDPEEYKIPFSSETFDLVYADQVIEHVHDLDSFIREAKRVLKSNGVFVGYYPSSRKFIEPHVGVPLGTMCQQYWWIRLCVNLGLYYRCKFKECRNPEAKIHSYLVNNTRYRSKRCVARLFKSYGFSVSFREQAILQAMDRQSARVILSVPGGPRLFGSFWSCLLVAQRTCERSNV